jgi:hypothetical protein
VGICLWKPILPGRSSANWKVENIALNKSANMPYVPLEHIKYLVANGVDIEEMLKQLKSKKRVSKKKK